ncbi:MAG: peptide-methionine (S)-S-oxide reductase MsrA [Lysobacter sp.]
MNHRNVPSRMRRTLGLPGFVSVLLLAACAQPSGSARADAGQSANAATGVPTPTAAPPAARQRPVADTPTGTGAGPAVAIFAGGCFWCMEPPYDALPGVISTESGYIGGHVARPTYEQVSAGGTGHAEAVRVTYDPRRIGYPKLLEVFWRNIDPVAVDRQFCDSGDQYRSAIFPIDEGQRRQAEASRAALQSDPRFRQPIATRIEATATFYPAEGYHQDYYKKNPVRYKYYRYSCGRDRRLQELWGEAG